MEKPRVTCGFHKPFYQDDYLNTLFAFIYEYFVLFFFIIKKKKGLTIDVFPIFELAIDTKLQPYL